ncbi:MAG TPA: SRPBCC family protein [Casimicrobiaceae bacterium]|nr:SRPBCC family protein [Casimicrobiaceae bacterium]
MQLRQRFSVAHPRAQVWDFFGRMEEVTPCMPGAALVEPPVGNAAKFKLSVKLGPITAAFVGDAEVERDGNQYRGVIRGNARDNRGDSRVKGVVDYALTDESNGHATEVDINVDFTLTGRLAQFSRAGIVNDLAARLTADFARNLESALANQSKERELERIADTSETTSAPRVASAQAPAGENQLKAGNLLLAVLWHRIKALFSAFFARR